MVHMPWREFFLWNAAGGITWAASVIGLGYFFGHSLHVIEKVLGVGGVIAVVIAAVVGLVVVAALREAEAARSTTTTTPAAVELAAERTSGSDPERRDLRRAR